MNQETFSLIQQALLKWWLFKIVVKSRVQGLGVGLGVELEVGLGVGLGLGLRLD